MEQIKEFADRYLTQIQFIGPMDIVEIILISLMVYYLLIFIRNTRAWQLLKGVFVILVFLVIAEILQMDTILWIARTAFQFATIALIVVLQPELRKALEQLGQKNLIRSVIPFESSKPEEGLFSDRTIREIVKGCVEMSRAKTGALIVVRQLDSLAEYERTGIAVDGIVTSQLLINIFEKNTPLHDGAVIVQGNRVTYATCYLPLSDNMRLSKDLGTRHRAGVGISEVTDSMTVIVSEENGKISVAYEGTLSRGLTAEELDFGYRHSFFSDHPDVVVLRATVALTEDDPAGIREKMQDFMSRRKASQPLEFPSAGSTFKRPAGHFAGTLIDQCGLKGLTVGGAQVSEKHAGFVINRGGATFDDVTELMRQVQQRVYAETGVRLEPEIRIVEA